MEGAPQIVTFIIFAIIVGTALGYAGRLRNLNALKQRLADSWGKLPRREYSEGELKSLGSYFNNMKAGKAGTHFIDDITWHDLDMDRVYTRINSACSTIGEEYLMALLREPVFDGEKLKERETLMQLFEENSDIRLKLQFLLSRLGKARFVSVTDYFYGEIDRAPMKRVLYRLLSLFALATPVVAVFNFNVGLPLFIVSVMINMTVYYKVKNEIGHQLETISYILNMANCAAKIVKLDIKELEPYNAALRTALKAVRPVRNKGFNMLYTSGDGLTEYLKILLLKELIDYETIISVISKHTRHFISIYQTIGMLDSMLAAASYRKSIPFYTCPVLQNSSSSRDRHVSFTDICHPLIEKPVPNSADMRGSVLVTGSNASGKSTFLKTVAINAILAQTIHTCAARNYSSCYFMIFSSMALKDDLLKNESYYITEIKSLKRIVDGLRDEVPILCFIDEVLRGTNTIERIAASSQVLHYLSTKNCLCIAATHDIELTSILAGSFENFHFQESFSGSEIVFDYRLHSGKSTTRNAIKLLKVMGYADTIVENAEKRAAGFMDDGRWNPIHTP